MGYGGIGLGCGFYLDIFLGFYGLMEPVRISPARQRPSGMLIHDLNCPVLNDILLFPLKQGVRFQQLINRMNTVSPLRKQAMQFVKSLFPLLFQLIADFTNFFCLIILDRKSTRLNSSHVAISYAVF